MHTFRFQPAAHFVRPLHTLLCRSFFDRFHTLTVIYNGRLQWIRWAFQNNKKERITLYYAAHSSSRVPREVCAKDKHSTTFFECLREKFNTILSENKHVTHRIYRINVGDVHGNSIMGQRLSSEIFRGTSILGFSYFLDDQIVTISHGTIIIERFYSACNARKIPST